MTGNPGHWLTPEQSARMAMLDSVSRERAIAAIAAHLYASAIRASRQLGGDTPRDLYSMPMRIR